MTSVISIFDENIPEIDENEIDVNSLNEYMENTINKFYTIKHDILKFIEHSNKSELILTTVNDISGNIIQGSSHLKPYAFDPDLSIINSSKDMNISTKSSFPTFPEDSCLGQLIWNPGLPIPFIRDFIINTPPKTSNLYFYFVLPGFSIYDSDVGLNLLDYQPVVDNDCDFFSEKEDAITIFPGLPCAPPDITFCRSCRSFRIFKRRFTTCSPPYPCGYKQKTNYQISLVKRNFFPENLFSFGGLSVVFNADVKTSSKITFRALSNVPVDTFIDLLKKFDNNIYIRISKNNTIKFSKADDVLKEFIYNFNDLELLLKFGIFAISYWKEGAFFSISIISIKVRVNFYIHYFEADIGYPNNFKISNLRHDEDEIELFTSGQNITFELEFGGPISVSFNLFTGSLSKILKTAEDAYYEASDTIIGARTDLLAIILRLLRRMVRIGNSHLYNSQVALENIIKTASALNLGEIIRGFNPTISISLNLCIDPKIAVPIAAICSTIKMYDINVMDVFKNFIKHQIIPTTDSAPFEEVGDSIINAIPDNNIKNTLRDINNKVKYANNIYQGILTIAFNNAFQFLDRTYLNNINISPIVKVCIPIAA